MAKKKADLTIVPPTKATCPRHEMKSVDFVSLNAKNESVFRCAARDDGYTVNSIYVIPHYFTVTKGA